MTEALGSSLPAKKKTLNLNNMICEIIKILPPAKSKNGNTYTRVEFKCDGKFLKTDLCPDYRNFYRWSKVLKKGNLMGNLIQKDELTINADSRPIMLSGRKTKKFVSLEGKTTQDLCKMGIL
jgi:hypothetical protein